MDNMSKEKKKRPPLLASTPGGDRRGGTLVRNGKAGPPGGRVTLLRNGELQGIRGRVEASTLPPSPRAKWLLSVPPVGVGGDVGT